MTHRMTVRVYYEDTDMAGVVYYANYLKFIERGRSEWVRSLGIDQLRLKEEQGIVFPVRRVEADYLAPARLDDLLEVVITPVESTASRLVLLQEVFRGAVRLFSARVTLVAVGADFRPTRMPEALKVTAAS